MYWKIVRNDMANSKLITGMTMLFVAVAALLVTLSAVLMVHLTSAIDTLMKQAETSHFLQMHAGEIDQVRLSEFAEQNKYVDEYQMNEFLNVEGSKIHIAGTTLAHSVQDNGFSTQSEKFDYLLDLDGHVIEVANGDIYVPVSYWKDGIADLGDTVIVQDQTFTIAGFLRDSQMNSMLASSKRFLVSEQDYAAIQEAGTVEYLIEFRLKNLADLKNFEEAYTSAGLEANGPTITYKLFQMLNAISDGLMIAVILLISVLVVAIAFMCIRFTLLTKIEEDTREIGVMKAIGLRVADIQKMYLAKYGVIAVIGCMLGFACSYFLRDILLENIRLFMGETDKVSLIWLFTGLGLLLVFIVIMGYVQSVLKQFRKLSATQALRFGTMQGKGQHAKLLNLSANKRLPINLFLGIKDVLSRKTLYATMLAVLVLATFIIIVPQNLHNTIAAKSFITYMGIGNSDIRIDIPQGKQNEQQVAAVMDRLEHDTAIKNYTVLTTKKFTTIAEDGTAQNLKIELGDHTIFPLEYAHGEAPVAPNEVALSVLNAEELQKKVGDSLAVVINGQKKNLRISGIYSDITNGGKTAKAAFSDQSTDSMWSVVYSTMADPSLVADKRAEYAKTFSFAKVSGIDDYIYQTFGTTIHAIEKAARAALVIALLLCVLVTLLFMNMLIAKDQAPIAIMKALGFTNVDIATQYAARSIFVLLLAISMGTLLANTLGEYLTSTVIASFGAASFDFMINPLAAYVFCPLALTSVVLLATLFGTSRAGQVKIIEHIKE
ncbi:ABC transporter permease [Lysinibacillus capsici]|uniref:ABC transporter permease n=1 Tax=Lysinibacillus capsici TaxID=2115968 RepID=A0ABY8KLU9_9BACI|nr:ABC transporter permease [Lysinibacillus capsici]MDP1395564.1 ABC transporter permease [Lysinibacillus capsici]MDP1416003.1 ABC transporter permease [Lysinibacillus capsici]MDP1431926.1 ABC transporter permease [Lysinibacillus capsici]WGF38761.1 ABC transporter permease [Lysinibacillus capsici]